MAVSNRRAELFFTVGEASRHTKLLLDVSDALRVEAKGNVCERDAEVTRGPKTAKEFKCVKICVQHKPPNLAIFELNLF